MFFVGFQAKLFGFTSFNYFSIQKKNHEEKKNSGLLRNLLVWLDPIWKYSMWGSTPITNRYTITEHFFRSSSSVLHFE
jgi:hypothetical protein